MVASPLTLAALATAAVADLELVGTEAFGDGDGDYDAALVVDASGRRYVVRAPRDQAAELRQSADLVALNALTAGVRSRLPFDVPVYAGQVPIGDSRAVVYEYVAGRHIRMHDLQPGTTLTLSVGHSLAAIHSLPPSVVVDAGLPNVSAGDALRACVGLVDLAEATGRTPATLLERWDRVITHGELWQFQPTVVNGGLSVDTLLVGDDDTVIGILDWSGLKIGDPASDLHWLLAGTLPAVAETAFDAYAISRKMPVDRAFRLRARFYAELELAKWLLHGVDSGQQDIVEDAVTMMDALLDQVQGDEPLLTAAGDSPLGLDEVKKMLSREHPSIYPPAQQASTAPQDE